MVKRDDVNTQMQAIFKKHEIEPVPGLDGFWEAVEEIRAISQEDADVLEALAMVWETAED